MKLPRSFYQNPDTIYLSKQLLGKYLMTQIEGELTGGIILETESYLGVEDKAAHSFGGLKTKRTKTMFEAGGVSYVYLCYGIHHLFNIITHSEGVPHGILIRAIAPVIGIETMLRRRQKKKADSKLAEGPGSVSKCLGITLEHNGIDLSQKTIWVEDRGIQVSENQIQISKRIGVEYAKEWADKPLRFRLNF